MVKIMRVVTLIGSLVFAFPLSVLAARLRGTERGA